MKEPTKIVTIAASHEIGSATAISNRVFVCFFASHQEKELEKRSSGFR